MIWLSFKAPFLSSVAESDRCTRGHGNALREFYRTLLVYIFSQRDPSTHESVLPVIESSGTRALGRAKCRFSGSCTFYELEVVLVFQALDRRAVQALSPGIPDPFWKLDGAVSRCGAGIQHGSPSADNAEGGACGMLKSF